MEIGTISLLASLVVGGSQIWKFFEERGGRKEEKLAVFARKTEVDNEFKIVKSTIGEFSISLTDLRHALSAYAASSKVNTIATDLGEMATKQAVLEERVNHSIDGLEKIEIKLDKIIERL